MIKGKTTFALLALAGVTLSTAVGYAAMSSARPQRVSDASHAVDLSDDSQAMATNPVFLESNTGGTTIDLRITRNQLMYEITWHGMAPSSVRLQGAGTALTMVPNALPGSITAIEGVVGTNDNRILSAMESNPRNFSVTAGPTAGFTKVGAVDFDKILHVGGLASVDSADQEVMQQGVPAGDVGAHATVFLGASGRTINYAATWTGVTSPTALNVNQGAIGAIGGLTASLFKAPKGLDPTIVAVAGTTTASTAGVAALAANPAMFHTNLLTAKFPGGAARGQLFQATMAPPTTPPTTMPTTPPTTMPTMPTMAPTMTTMPKPTMPTMTPPMMPTGSMAPPTMQPPTSPAVPMPTLTATVGAPPHW